MGELHPTVTPGVVPGVARVVLPDADRGRAEHRGRSHGMDGVRDLLEAARGAGLIAGHLRGLLHIAIGRRVTRPDGSVVSTGLTWRELAALLKQLRFEKELVREVGAEPEGLAPRDRVRYWYTAIGRAKVDSREALADAESLVGPLKALGFLVGPAPIAVPPAAVAPRPTAEPPDAGKAKKPRKKK